jgi:hypothetical protein
VSRPAYPYDRSGGLTEEDVRRIARAEVRGQLATPALRNAWTPRSIPFGTVDRVPVVTALPGRPVDGDEVYFDTGLGFLWRFVYLSAAAGAYRWVAVGGQTPLFAEVAAGESTASATYADLATDGPGVTIPLDGEWDVAWGASSTGTTATAQLRVAFKRGSAAADDADSILQQPAGVSYVSAGPGSRIRRVDLAAGDDVKLQYDTNAGTATFSDRWITAAPTRVRST